MKNFILKLKKRTGFVQGLALGLGMTTLGTYAVITIPHTFTNNTVISSSEMNQNFAQFKTHIDELEVGFVAGSSISPATISCDYPSFSTEHTTSMGVDRNDGGFNGSMSTYNVTTAGVYEIKIGAVYTTAGGTPTLVARLDINGTNYDLNLYGSGTQVVLKRLAAGDSIQLTFGCYDGMGAGRSISFDNDQFVYSVKKL